MSKLIESASKYISSNSYEKRVGIVEAEEKYSTSDHLHMDTHEGEKRVIIKGIAHSEKNAAEVKQKVTDAIHKKWGKGWEDMPRYVAADNALKDIPGHHEAADNPEDSHKMRPKVYDSVDSYVKHAASSDHLWATKPGRFNENVIIHEASTRSYGRYTQILFSTGAKSWQDNHDKVTKIHKSVISAHPDKVAGKFGGDGSGGYISVNNKKHVDIVKDHIRKAGGIIND